jgi:REP element-mobilizing transposase RayT
MSFDSNKHHRRTIRLSGYDYASAGGYFITICTHDRECLFGKVVDYEMRLNSYGEIAREEWYQTAFLRPYVMLDAFVVMPNHVHGIIGILDDSPVGARRALPSPAPAEFGKPPARALSSIVGGFKSAVTKRINRLRDTPGGSVWQRNYYEHVIRNERELDAFRDYIVNNPAKWSEDRYYQS